MTLTDSQIHSARVPPGLNQVEIRDDEVRGLLLRVYTSGARTWMLAYRRQEDRRRRFMKLGAYPGVSINRARALAEMEITRIGDGEDPLSDREERRPGEVTETIASLARQYLRNYAKKFKRPASYAMDQWQLETYVLPRWGSRPAEQVTKDDVRKILNDLADGRLAARGKPTKVAPRNLRALLSKLFEWAIERGSLAANPVVGTKLPDRVREHLRKGGKDRVLSDDEIGTLWAALHRLDADARRRKVVPVSAAAFRLILLTAQRPGEVFTMRWRDIEDGVWWVIPAEVAKNGEPNRVYLSPQAREILGELHQHTPGASPWALESPRKPGTHLTTIKTATQSILRRTEMRPWSPHDLRRTAASKMRAMGVTRLVVQGILNHKDRSVTAIYDRYGADPEKQQALTDWGRRVEEIAGGERGAIGGFQWRGKVAE